MTIHPRAGQLALASDLTDIPKLIAAYYEDRPDAHVPEQCVAFGTSGHRGSSFLRSFNEWHILSITQAICLYRRQNKIDGPLFLGIDTHALSRPAFESALEVLAANGVDVMIAQQDEFTPTPVISHAILTYNDGRTSGLADGIVITPSHNPPDAGGFKYDPPHGGPAAAELTQWIQDRANGFLTAGLKGVERIPFRSALTAITTHAHDYMTPYVEDLENIIDMEAIRNSAITLGVDPLGGAGVHYWEPIAKRYQLDLRVVNDTVDPTFRFMTLDWDGKIRMDPSSPYAMQSFLPMANKFDISFACDTDHDRHGIVTKAQGLLPPNHYLATCIDFLFTHRPDWPRKAAVGKTIVSSSMIDRVTRKLSKELYEVPVGFKYFVDGLLNGDLGFGGEESAGASFLRRNGAVWTTDKDGIIAALLSAEMSAKGRDPGQVYSDMTQELGTSYYERIDAAATGTQKKQLQRMSSAEIRASQLAGEKIQAIVTSAAGNREPIGGVKVIAENGWFAARPSGTEDVYKIYAESFQSEQHLRQIQAEAESIVAEAFGPSGATQQSAANEAKS
jgi:phosphoglucomutase